MVPGSSHTAATSWFDSSARYLGARCAGKAWP